MPYNRTAFTQDVPFRFERCRDIRMHELGLLSASKTQIDTGVVGIGDIMPDALMLHASHTDDRIGDHKRVWHDVTNADHSSVYLRFAGGQEAEFMHSDIAAALKPKWYILGERGAIGGHWRHETVKTRRWSGDLIEERLAPAQD